MRSGSQLTSRKHRLFNSGMLECLVLFVMSMWHKRRLLYICMVSWACLEWRKFLTVAPSSFAVNLEPVALRPWPTDRCHLHCLKHPGRCSWSCGEGHGDSHAFGNACFQDNSKVRAGNPKSCVKPCAVQCLASGSTDVWHRNVSLYDSHRLMECGWKAQGVCGPGSGGGVLTSGPVCGLSYAFLK